MSRIFFISSNTMTVPYPVYPLGMAMVASALDLAGHKVMQFDFLAEESSCYRLDTALRTFIPDIVGISLRNIDTVDSFTADTAWALASVKGLMEVVRKATGAPVVLGGAAFSIMPEDILAYLGADHGIVGDGVVLFNWLIEKIERGEQAPAIVRNDSGFHEEEMSFAPLWDKELVRYYTKKSGVVGLQTKRGCPNKCVYCTYPVIEGSHFRCREAGSVIEDILQLKTDHGISTISFTDSVFNDTHDFYLEIAEALLSRDVRIKWSAYFQPGRITRDNVGLLKRAGLYALEVGTDASSDTTLEGLDKPFCFDDVVHFNEACVNEEMPCVHYIMFGGPGETQETIEEGLRNIASLDKCVVIAFSGIRVFPGTQLHAISVKDGIMASQDTLLKPVFYYSPEVDAAHLNETLRSGFRRKKNRIFPPEAFQAKVQLLYRFGDKGPLWHKMISFG
ncbi:MAG: lipid biosynthesis B12-binding/radical SAM protein [Syntrophobacterales bacterium]|jgi:lipid biosynthesis B12-binding/radical SAM protein|nr:lipid biosynthesis B12-binding/radical SAM protein [Syntrophobacterales bacterium]